MKKVILLVLLVSSFLDAATEEQYNNCLCTNGNYWKLYSERAENVVSSVKYYGTVDSGYPALPENSYSYSCQSNYYKSYYKKLYLDYTGYRFFAGLGPLYLITAHMDVYHEGKTFYCRPCDQEDTPFPDKNETENSYSDQWQSDSSETNDNRQQCEDNNGTIEDAKINCVEYERCKIPNNDNNETNCSTPNTSFPALEENEEANLYWSGDADLAGECVEISGKIQSRAINCETEYRCVTQRCTEPDNPFPKLAPNERIQFSWVEGDTSKAGKCTALEGQIQFQRIECENNYRCVCTNTSFPWLSANEKIQFEWSGYSSEKSAQCLSIGGKEQSAKFSCVTQNRCIKVTEEEKKEKDECIASYVSPSDSTFHEDITLTGVEFGLHYSSRNIDENVTQQIAQRWSFSNHATFDTETNRLYLGSGSLWVVEPYLEDGLTVVKSGSSELLFDENGLHVQTRDLYTKEVENTFTYDDNDLLISVTNLYNETTTINRDANGTVQSITAPHGQTTYLHIDENGDLIEVQYEDTTSYTFEYEKHLMTLEREPNGNEFLHFFDDQGNVIKVIDAEQGEWDFGTSSDSTSGTHTITRASGDIITYQNHFLENGLLKTQKTLPTGDVILYTHAVDDSLSSTTSCGQTHTNTYKLENGTLAKDPLQDRRILESSTKTTPSGLSKTSHFTTNYNFDANNTLISIENTAETNGAISTSLRDYNQSISILTSPEGRVTQTTYDSTTQLPRKISYANLKPTIYKYDALGRVIKTKQGRRVTKYSYDERGNVAEVHNVQRDTKTSYTYDLLGRGIQTTYDDGATEHFTYDSNGNLITRTIPTPADHTFGYNGVNKRTDYTSPEQKQTTYTYDKQRRVTKITKPSQKTIDITYTNGRVTVVTTPEATTSYQYSCQNNPSNITKGSESIDFTYDGTLLTSLVQSGQLNQTLNYSYNNNFQVASFTYANQTQNYTYDLDGLLLTSGAYALTRDAQNALTTDITDGTLNITQTYNAFGELKTQKSQNFKLTLARKEGRIAKKVENVVDYYRNKKGKLRKRNDKTTYAYTYDNRDRLIEVKEDNVTIEAYTYDANGNRASATINGVTTTASYTLDDNLIVYGQNSYLYDEDGYLQEKTTPEGTTTYSYGTLGELKEVTHTTSTGSVTVSYEHNANNQSVAKLVDGEVVEKYLWRDLTTLLAVYDGNDNLLQRFEYVDQRMPLSMTDSNGTKYYLHYDQVGTLRAVSDINHHIIKEVTYDTYGNILEDSNETFKVPFGFAGGLYDQDTKLTRFGYRDYDAYTGKWTAKDPIGFDGGDSNLYEYVLGDPVNFVDPSGLIYLPSVEHKTYKTDGTCVLKCLEDRASLLGTSSGLSVLPLLNLKKPSDISPFGGGKGNKSPFTSIDKKWPNLPGANPKGGLGVPRGTIGRIKPLGTLGTTAIGLGAFGLGLGIGTLGDCISKCTTTECD